MSTSIRLLSAFALAAATAIPSAAQLVFVPDTNLRLVLNDWIPNLVDASGYADPQHPTLLDPAYSNLFFVVDWSPADMSGLEALDSLSVLHIRGDEPSTVVHINALPSSLTELWLDSITIGSLPAFPPALVELDMKMTTGLAQLPPLPQTLKDLDLQCPDLEAIPAWPAALEYIWLRGSPAIDSIPPWPLTIMSVWILEIDPTTPIPSFEALDDLYQIMLGSFDATGLSELPPGLQFFLLWKMHQLESLPSLPPTLYSMTLKDLTSLTCLPPLPPGLNNLNIDVGAEDSIYCAFSCLPNLSPGTQVGWYGEEVHVNLGDPHQSSWICNILDSPCFSTRAAVLGQVYWDQNANGSNEVGEPLLPGAQVKALPGPFISSTGADGTYELSLEQGGVSVSTTFIAPYVTGVSPASRSIYVPSLTAVLTGNDFGVTMQPNVQDLRTYAAVVTPRPGFQSSGWIFYRNMGTQVQDGSISMEVDGDMSFLSATPPPDVVNGNSLTWNFTGLQVWEERTIQLELITPVSAALGTPIEHVVAADPLATDQTPVDNVMQLSDIVVGSLDPNDKQVTPNSLTPVQVQDGDRVTYTVRFQNTGTYPAERVLITDTLSSDLQWTSIEVIGASHAHTWYVDDGVLHVLFESIMLPDSTSDEVNSHGFVIFSMRPLSTLMVGESVANTANIYFDFNEPVITNEAIFSVDASTSIVGEEGQGLLLAPNPALEQVVITGEEPGLRWMLHDAAGRVLREGRTQAVRTVIGLNELSAGVYQLRVQRENGWRTGRLVKR